MAEYVEPSYWVYGYAEGDRPNDFTYGFAAAYATGTTKSAGNYKTASHREIASAKATVLAAPILISVYPGVNLNAKSSVIAASVYRTKGSGLVTAQSSTKVGGRIFWENTQPASGAWTVIVPQAEGTGK